MLIYLDFPEVIQHHWGEVGLSFLYYVVSNMFFDEPTYLSDPDCQAHFVPALSSIFWDAVSIPTKQFEWFEIHGK